MLDGSWRMTPASGIVARMIAEAGKIRLPGKVEELSSNAAELVRHVMPDMMWRAEVIGGLARATCEEFNLITAAIGGPIKADISERKLDLPLIAWRSRNSLELIVWSAWCVDSESNAWRFYEDAHRDRLDMLIANLEYGRYTERSNWIEEYSRAIKEAQREAVCSDISLDGDYKRVSDAAREISPELSRAFRFANKLASKFAHPTVLAIVRPSIHLNLSYALFYYAYGCYLFAKAFPLLEAAGLLLRMGEAVPPKAVQH